MHMWKEIGFGDIGDIDMVKPIEITLRVKSVTVVCSSGCDVALFNCEGESPVYPFDSGIVTMRLDIAHGQGAEYIEEHFGITPIVVGD